MTPYCTACDRFYRCKRNEVTVVSGAAYSGDLYECPECYAGVVIGFGRNPFEMDPGRIAALRVRAPAGTFFTESKPLPRHNLRTVTLAKAQKKWPRSITTAEGLAAAELKRPAGAGAALDLLARSYEDHGDDDPFEDANAVDRPEQKE